MLELNQILWEKAEENLAAAQSEFISGRYNTSASRAYYACFLAAVYAPAQAGIRPTRGDMQWGHDFVQGEFSRQLINQRKVYPSELRATLDQNRSLRRVADYDRDHVTEIRADRALGRAERFVAAIRSGRGSNP
jgi:uncharacterized protein (UPF0332 family)